MKNLIIFLFVSFFFISLVSAVSLGTFERELPVNLLYICDNCTSVNLTSVTYPNSTFALLGQFPMTQNGTLYNYTFNQTQDLGFYSYSVCGNLNGVLTCSENTDFKITQTGREFSSSQGITSVGILLAAILLSFFFSRLSQNLMDRDETFPLGFIFVFLSIALGIYVLFLSYTFSIDIVEYASLSDLAQVIFITFLWIIVSIVVLSMALMLISFIKEVAKVVEVKKFGEGWSPISHTYES